MKVIDIIKKCERDYIVVLVGVVEGDSYKLMKITLENINILERYIGELCSVVYNNGIGGWFIEAKKYEVGNFEGFEDYIRYFKEEVLKRIMLLYEYTEHYVIFLRGGVWHMFYREHNLVKEIELKEWDLV